MMITSTSTSPDAVSRAMDVLDGSGGNIAFSKAHTPLTLSGWLLP
jgi:hypothetical protein